MRNPAVVLIALTVLVSPAVAEDAVQMLPEIVIGGAAPATAARSERCVEVEIGSSRALNCLNQKLKREVDRVNPNPILPPVDAKSSDLKVGTVNIPAVQQQYGRNFGVSAFPYRPAAPVFTAPLHR
ncbi:hypothetical protein HNR60_003060 [Rhodopseudomonas rhenobacensis]|uniref:Uncharacterized protein n=1 Tax=Rhodopseudomonas rhenobacensis TaxID=87461 RepID=A0A7W7Z698_9BRAD|nr:hypothetical protein [Rhodopseudomonas rhenobacensis]MBB5048297.1 hypothetical protein [Rhodopseudomonas rhenobacensis]